MRNIINISLPRELRAVVEKEVKKGKFASTSEYIRHLVRTQALAKEFEKQRKHFEAGKGKVLRSFKDLR